ncbi:MAG: V-type ATP synthase subunit A, partial [Treponema sp.]|nr:V-type ATP synthase subunit A [Treponema sp.]
VTQHTKRFIRCFWALDRDLANARHYPAIGWIDSYSEYADEVKDWWERQNPEWLSIRSRALDLLKTEQRLQQIVRLIGPDALPDSERIVLIVSDMIKNGFLQQNSYDKIDSYCAAEKQIVILSLIMDFYDRTLALIKAGAPLGQISSLQCREEIVRIKSVVANDKLDQVKEIQSRMENEISELERTYRKVEL